ncbi:WXG100 family type VII secretion target [Kitasatospora acidiphila]|nr:type VII secretion target [Kitasatospora acidiphila]
MQEPEGSQTLQVNPDVLTASGKSGQQIAEQIPGETTKIVQPSDQASEGLQGWATAGALHDCTAAWKTLLDGLAKDMDGYGGKLVAMAQNYRSTDQSVAAQLAAINQPAPTPAAATTTQSATTASTMSAVIDAPYVLPPGSPDPFATKLIDAPYVVPAGDGQFELPPRNTPYVPSGEFELPPRNTPYVPSGEFQLPPRNTPYVPSGEFELPSRNSTQLPKPDPAAIDREINARGADAPKGM